MKLAKIIIPSLILLVISTAFISKSPEQRFVSVDNQLEWDGGGVGGADFVIETGTKSLLDDAPNWEAAFENYSGGCSGSTKICKVRIEYSYTPPFEVDPLPTVQEIIDAVHDNYNDIPNPNVFISFTIYITIRGIHIKITIIVKS